MGPIVLLCIVFRVTKANLVHPLVITNILSRNEKLAVGCVKNYLEQWLATENEKIKENTKIIEENVKKSAELEKQIHIYDEEYVVLISFINETK